MARYFENTEALADVFSLFSDKDILKIIFFMYSRQNFPVALSVIASKTGIGESETEALMDKLCSHHLAYCMVIETEQGNIKTYTFAGAEEKYATIYMLDGQAVLSKEIDNPFNQGVWNVSEHVESMMSQTDYKAIVVAIETIGSKRNDELIPDLGEIPEWAKKFLTTKQSGTKFCNFICDEVVPYIEANYNVYADRDHRGICGSSYGGLHELPYWRNIFPEFLEAMFTHNVTALTLGGLIEESRLEMDNDGSGDEQVGSGGDYIYFDNSQTKWERGYAYWWADGFAATTNKITGEAYGESFPGLPMEKVGDTEIYRIVIPVKANHIIFNSGVTDEEVKNGKQSYQSSDAAFNETTNAGQVYRIDLSQDATHGRGAEKEKYTYPAGSWSNDAP